MLATWRRERLKRRRALGALALVLALAGCDTDGDKVEPTEPWRAGAQTTGEAEVREPTRYVVAAAGEAGTTLDFEAKGKEAAPRGRVPVSGGWLEFDPSNLDSLRGELAFDLTQLVVLGGEGSDVAPHLEQSRAARRWLGLGSEVAKADRLLNGRATFRVRMAKGLSQRVAHRGEVLRDAERKPRNVRRVRGTVTGDLTLRGVEVRHNLRVDLEFHWKGAPSRATAPERVDVILLNPDRIPLAEHQIFPRDERGVAQEEARAMIGKQVGSVARVTGKLRLTRDAGEVLELD